MGGGAGNEDENRRSLAFGQKMGKEGTDDSKGRRKRDGGMVEDLHSFQFDEDFSKLGCGEPVQRGFLRAWVFSWRLWTLGNILEFWEELIFNSVVFVIIAWLVYRIASL